MRSEVERSLAIKWKAEGRSYAEIAELLSITRNEAINLCYYKLKTIKRKSGPPKKLKGYHQLLIKRTICHFHEKKTKVNAPKIIKECNLDVSLRTVQRHLKCQGLKYKRSKSKINLSKSHKEKRLEIITEWITKNQKWETTIFSDEKRFSLDGPDDWRSYMYDSNLTTRIKRQCHGGGVMVWLMTMPNGLMAFKVLEGIFNSKKYIELLKEMIIPIMKLNYGSDFCFQEDNSSVHKSKVVQRFLKESNISVLDWPAKSPDLNIVEDCWKTISDLVYDGKQFNKKDELIKKIKEVIDDLNTKSRDKVKNLYQSIKPRLCKVLKVRGNLYN
jgi:transposase